MGGVGDGLSPAQCRASAGMPRARGPGGPSRPAGPPRNRGRAGAGMRRPRADRRAAFAW